MSKQYCNGCYYLRKLGYYNLRYCAYCLETGKCISLIEGAGVRSPCCIKRITPSQYREKMQMQRMKKEGEQSGTKQV